MLKLGGLCLTVFACTVQIMRAITGKYCHIETFLEFPGTSAMITLLRLFRQDLSQIIFRDRRKNSLKLKTSARSL
jgi:hypothetical protein